MIQLVAAGRTARLYPPLKYLPWITVNDDHDETKEKDIIADLNRWACKNYKGDIKLD